MDPGKLFKKVVHLSGLSAALGPGTVRRALKDVGADPDSATVDDYCRALPRLEARMRAFMPGPEAAMRARSIARLKDGDQPAPE
jgi:hypothetical protein